MQIKQTKVCFLYRVGSVCQHQWPPEALWHHPGLLQPSRRKRSSFSINELRLSLYNQLVVETVKWYWIYLVHVIEYFSWKTSGLNFVPSYFILKNFICIIEVTSPSERFPVLNICLNQVLWCISDKMWSWDVWVILVLGSLSNQLVFPGEPEAQMQQQQKEVNTTHFKVSVSPNYCTCFLSVSRQER